MAGLVFPDRDLFKIDEKKTPETKVVMAFFEGRKVFPKE